MITIVFDPKCGWSQRAKAHVALLETETTFVDTTDTLYNPDLPMPQVYVNDKYVGGFYDLVKELPV